MTLTLPQQDVYFEQLLFPNDPIYNLGAKIEIKGEIDLELLKRAVVEMIQQHDAYRSVIKRNGEQVEIVINNEQQIDVGFLDFSVSDDPLEQANAHMQKEFVRPFDMFDGRHKYRFAVVKIRKDFHYLFSVFHHVITDGWGTSLMFQRLVQNYNELLEFDEVKTEYPFSYREFVEDDKLYQDSEALKKDLQYWSDRFETLPENLLEKYDEAVHLNQSKRSELIVERAVYDQMNQLAKQYRCSDFQFILGVLFTYFGRKHGNKDFAIGMPVLNRSKSIYKKTVGLFMGITPFRMQLNFEQSFEELLKDIKSQLRQDYRHQRLPLGRLIKERQLYNEKERLFNITLSYQKQDFSTNFLNTKTRVIPMDHEAERGALLIFIREFDLDQDVKIDFDYNLNYFDEAAILAVSKHFYTLLKEIIKAPKKKLKEFVFLPKEEKNRLLVEFNDTHRELTMGNSFLDLFADRVGQHPEKVAVRDSEKDYSYGELDRQSTQIAAYLNRQFGTKNRSPIAVLLHRSADLILVLLGILKSGRPYIPFDPSFPEERLQYIISHSQAKILIQDKETILKDNDSIVKIALNEIFNVEETQEAAQSNSILPNDTAYLIYTSGSTGNPKGVEIGHRALLNFLTSFQVSHGLAADDVMYSVTNSSFDMSLLEFFAPLISGASLYVAKQELLSNPKSIIDNLKELRPTIIHATPSFYQMLFHAGWTGDKALRILCGGDLISESLAEKMVAHSAAVWNVYGPSETTIWSSYKKFESAGDANNIGKPVQNTQIYILDEYLQLLPIGTPGAIYIAGLGLAKGYYKNKELTKAKFIENPYGDGRLYETGDLGKWTAEGDILFLGRNDNQVKIRGYRIELGDIETKLNDLEEVKTAVVVAKKGDEQDAILMAFVILEQEETSMEAITAALAASLPHYMIPNLMIPVQEFPLTPNQKVDRKALSLRSIESHDNKNNFKAPNSKLEIELAEYWQEILNSEVPISTHQNFFALGGHSLTAVKLIGFISERLQLEVPLKAIFDFPTIESQARYLSRLQPSELLAISPAAPKDLYALTPAQHSIWLAAQQAEGSIAYNMSAAFLVEGAIDLPKMKLAMWQIIDEHEILRTNFIEKEGIPYQKIKPGKEVNFDIARNKSTMESIHEQLDQLTNKEFDLQNDLLLRTELFALEAGQNLLFFSTHHIVMDGQSLEVFIKELIERYNQKTERTKRKPDLQFKDYSEWLNREILNLATTQKRFWKDYLSGYQKKETFDRDAEAVSNDPNGASSLLEFSEELTAGLKSIAVEQKVTFFSVLLSALVVLSNQLAEHSDICIATADSGRDRPELKDQLGMFVKTILVRTQIGADQDFIELLNEVQSNLLKTSEFKELPADQKIHSLIDLMLVYQNPEFTFEKVDQLENLTLSSFPLTNRYSRMPLVFNAFESGNKLKISIDYNGALYKAETITFISSQLIELTKLLVENPSIQLSAVRDELKKDITKDVDFDFNF